MPRLKDLGWALMSRIFLVDLRAHIIRRIHDATAPCVVLTLDVRRGQLTVSFDVRAVHLKNIGLCTQ
ncbi:hypothetical protein EVAR_14005_1 [Eumeta japonica]|uniref:Uncharacterized protein n=1 Tax=Eumeta variegata TaxID=151549 RepID=A0A4C1XAN8_EUMVA|nr:hypothetical protein EVAR_14005_1 [Eumeta japonica]